MRGSSGWLSPAISSVLCLALSAGIQLKWQFSTLGMEKELEEMVHQNLWEGGLDWVLGFKKQACLLENQFHSETLSLMGLYRVKAIGLKPLI